MRCSEQALPVAEPGIAKPQNNTPRTKPQNLMAIYLTVGVALFCAIWTCCHLPRADALGTNDEERAKLREFLVLDIRANSQYSAWYVTLIGVIGTIVASNQAPFKPVLNAEHLWPFGVSFLAASLATLFFPAGYGTRFLPNLRWVWLRSVLCEQLVVIFTAYGIWDMFRVLAGQ